MKAASDKWQAYEKTARLEIVVKIDIPRGESESFVHVKSLGFHGLTVCRFNSQFDKMFNNLSVNKKKKKKKKNRDSNWNRVNCPLTSGVQTFQDSEKPFENVHPREKGALAPHESTFPTTETSYTMFYSTVSIYFSRLPTATFATRRVAPRVSKCPLLISPARLFQNIVPSNAWNILPLLFFFFFFFSRAISEPISTKCLLIDRDC